MTDWVVSQGDVEEHPKFGELSLDQILYSYGMNVSEGYENDGRNKEACEDGDDTCQHGFTHRSTFTGKVFTGPRYFGTARTDGYWKRFTENFVAV
jgi:hypothetical protein